MRRKGLISQLPCTYSFLHIISCCHHRLFELIFTYAWHSSIHFHCLSSIHLVKTENRQTAWAFTVGGYDSADSEVVQVITASAFHPPPVSPPKVDDKTIKRQNTPNTSSVIYTAIPNRTVLPQLILYLFPITMAWSSSRGQVLDAVLASIAREIYREFVCRSPLGKTESSGVLAIPPFSRAIWTSCKPWRILTVPWNLSFQLITGWPLRRAFL